MNANRVRRIAKKTAALTSAAVMTTVGTASFVWAEDSYVQIEKDAYKKAVSELFTNYVQSEEDIQKAYDGTKTEFTVNIEDGARSLIGLFAPFDISWLKEVKIAGDVSIDEEKGEALDMKLLLNNQEIISMLGLIEFATNQYYIQIPQLTDSSLKMDLTENGGTSLDMSTSVSLAKNLVTDKETMNKVEAVLDRYGSLVLDYMEEGETGSEKLEIEGIAEECSTYEGVLTADKLGDMIEEVLTQAKSDEDIKFLIESFSEDKEKTYDEYVKGIDKILEEADTDSVSEEEGKLISKIWVDAEGKVVGRQIKVEDDGTTIPVVTYHTAKDDKKRALEFSVDADDMKMKLQGSGIEENDNLTGNYVIYIDDVPTVNVEVEHYNTAIVKENSMDGSFIFTISPDGDEDVYNAFSVYKAVVDIKTEKGVGGGSLSIYQGEDKLASMSFSADYGDGAEFLDSSSLGKVYDVENEEDMTNYTAGMSYDTVLDNLEKAGITQETMEQIMNTFMGGDGEEAEVEVEETAAE